MKSFYQYLAESVKEYRYRIKSVVPMDDNFISTVKKALFKYNVTSVSAVKKTPMQNAPLDFRDVGSAEVHIIDIVTTVPASSYVLATGLHSALQLSPKFLIVRGENEPVELEAEAIENRKEPTGEALLDDATMKEAEATVEVAYGDEYNKKFLNYLAKTKAENEDAEVPAIEEVKKVAKFSWLNPKDSTVADDFNKDQDTVKPVHVNSVKGKAEKPSKTAVHGNYDDAGKGKK
jgi:hypothetical protein